MSMQFNFLGQSITLGVYSGYPNKRTIVVEGGSAFSLIKYIEDYGDNFASDSGVYIFTNHEGLRTFAIGYQHTESHGLRTFFKWATDGNLIPEDDTIPIRGPWNDWIMTGTQLPSYSGFDPDNITVDDRFLNSIMFYTQDEALYPYWYGYGNVTITAEEARQYSGVDIYVVVALKNWDGTENVGFTEPTPILMHDGAYTNWVDRNTVTDPTYRLDGFGLGSGYIYSPLDIAGAWEVEHFNDDPSQPGGGDGAYTNHGNDIKADGPIGLSAADSGFLTLFSPTKGQLWALYDYMWTSDLVDNIKKIFADPMDAIIHFGIVPLNLSSYRESMGSTVIMGNINTGVTMYKLSTQYYYKDMGSVYVPEKFGNALDYGGFSKAQIYLPFIGFVPVNIDDVMASDVKIEYYVDLLSGDTIAKITCKKRNTYLSRLNSVVYQHRGNCMITVPLTGMNYAEFYKNLALAPLHATQSVMSGNPVSGVASGIAGAMSMLQGPEVQHSGNYGGATAALQNRTPFIYISRPNQQMPANYSKYVGYPSFITYKLEQLSGYTQVDSVIDNTVKATEEEKMEIERLLKEGVYFNR